MAHLYQYTALTQIISESVHTN